MTSLQEAWGMPMPERGTGQMIGNNFYTGQNRNQDPSMMPSVRNSNQQPQSYSNHQQQQQAHSPNREESEEWDGRMPRGMTLSPQISVNVEKSEEERELFRYLRSRLGEMDWDRTVKYFKNKCSRQVKNAQGRCGCEGFSEHMDDCKKCRSTCKKKSEFRENLMLYLLVGIFILLLVNLFTPKRTPK